MTAIAKRREVKKASAYVAGKCFFKVLFAILIILTVYVSLNFLEIYLYDLFKVDFLLNVPNAFTGISFNPDVKAIHITSSVLIVRFLLQTPLLFAILRIVSKTIDGDKTKLREVFFYFSLPRFFKVNWIAFLFITKILLQLLMFMLPSIIVFASTILFYFNPYNIGIYQIALFFLSGMMMLLGLFFGAYSSFKYFLVPIFILNDHKIKIKGLFKKSKIIMKSYKGTLLFTFFTMFFWFLLSISVIFIPFILSYTFAIGLIYGTMYINEQIINF